MSMRIGTSGWQYADWRGRFYPRELPVRSWLESYAQRFEVVEVNNSFYRLPARETFEDWARRTPEDFEFVVKASRFLSHIKRLKEPAEPVERLMSCASGLGTKLGPILLQLPPRMKADVDRLADTLACFPRTQRVAFEPRDDSWFNDEVCALLRHYDCALVLSDRKGRPITPQLRTASWGYLRFHDGGRRPAPGYYRRSLSEWVDRAAALWPADATVYAFFNNDPFCAAPRDAVRFGEMVQSSGRPISRIGA